MVFRARIHRSLAAATIVVVALCLWFVPGTAAAAPADRKIDIVSFNVLAPIWAAPQWYPADMDPGLLETAYRRPRIAAFLRAQAATADVVVLQEVQDSELPHLAAALGSGFEGVMSTNARDFWSNWVDDDLGWAPNGTAVFIRKAAFGTPRFAELDQTTGNSVAWVTARHLASGKRLRVASVHLDSDSQVNRQVELAALLELWGPGNENTVDIIGGDINEDTVHGSLSLMIDRAGFVDVLASLGNREQTHPWLESYYMADKWGILDHVLARNAVPVSGDVIDSGVWAIDDETARIEANFDACGSDHFPVVATVRPRR
jgi:endonuclease/exonuclease/phosphatase family metal-dependent hydrolase